MNEHKQVRRYERGHMRVGRYKRGRVGTSRNWFKQVTNEQIGHRYEQGRGDYVLPLAHHIRYFLNVYYISISTTSEENPRVPMVPRVS